MTVPSAIFMQRALELAALGRGTVSPNPLVGCVMVCQNRVIGEGWHQRYGQAHAEVNAVEAAVAAGFTHLLPQSTAYVTLEPCSHFGKTPPCADLLIEKKIREVVVCNLDPNPLVAGKGLEKLRAAGVAVSIDLLAAEGRALNARFFTFFEKKRPYVVLKWAETADGFIGKTGGKPLVISNILSRTLSHKWRAEEDAIMVGTNTALNDNPRLNVRLWTGRNPTRVVTDTAAKLPTTLHLFDGTQPTLVYKTAQIEAILADLYAKKIQSVLVEGGARLLQSFLDAGLFDEIRVFRSSQRIDAGVTAPKIRDHLAPVLVQKLMNDQLLTYRLH